MDLFAQVIKKLKLLIYTYLGFNQSFPILVDRCAQQDGKRGLGSESQNNSHAKS